MAKKKSRWTPQEYVRAIDARLSGMSFADIGRMLGRSADVVRRTYLLDVPDNAENAVELISQAANRPNRAQFPWGVYELAYLRRLSVRLTPEQIAIVLGRSLSRVKAALGTANGGGRAREAAIGRAEEAE
jgi:hypothetical protein